MTTTDDAPRAGGADDLAWRRLAVAPALVLVAVAVLWNAAAFAVDASPLEQRIGSWGVAFGSVLTTVVYGGVPLVLAAGAALSAVTGPPAWRRPLAWGSSVIASACAVGLLVAGLSLLGGPAAEVVFAAVSLVLAPVLVLPLALCRRAGRRWRTAAVSATT
jgi:hypothetical protein